MISNYLERKTLYDLAHMMKMIDLVAIDVDTRMIDSGFSLEKMVTELFLK